MTTLSLIHPSLQVSFNDLQLMCYCDQLVWILQNESIIPCFSIDVLNTTVSLKETSHDLHIISELSARLALDLLEGDATARSIELDVTSISLCLEPAVITAIKQFTNSLNECKAQITKFAHHSSHSVQSDSSTNLSSSFMQFNLSIEQASLSLLSYSTARLVLSLTQLQASLLITQMLQASLSLLDISLSTQSRTLLQRHTTDAPFLVLALENHSLSADLTGIQAELGFDFPEILAILRADWSESFSSSSQHSSDSSELIQHLILLLHEKYIIEVNVDDMSLSLMDREQSIACALSSNGNIMICVNDYVICEYMILLYGLTCVFHHYVNNQYSHTSSLIDLPVSLSLHVTANSYLSLSTAVDQIELTRIADLNPTNSLLLNLNTSRLLLDVISHFKQALRILSSSSSAHNSHSSLPLHIECDIPAVMLRMELAHNLVIFIGVHHLQMNADNGGQRFHIQCVFNANYTLDSPLQTLLEELNCLDMSSFSSIVQCTGMLNEDISVSVTPSSSLQMNLPWNVLRALSTEENEIRERSYVTEIINNTGVSLM